MYSKTDFNHVEKALHAACDDKTGRLWKSATGVLSSAIERHSEGHSKVIMSVVFSPDRLLLALASLDKTIKI